MIRKYDFEYTFDMRNSILLFYYNLVLTNSSYATGVASMKYFNNVAAVIS